MSEKTITILQDVIPVNDERIGIWDLKLLRDNPRVYLGTHGQSGFDRKTSEEQQLEVFEALKKEPSVKGLLRDLQHHGGLMEPILVRLDTMEVIEGNSRLAAYRVLHHKTNDERWAEIDCATVSSLTENQQAAYLSQVHVKGKTKWSAYEKANFAFIQKHKRNSFRSMAQQFGESEATLRTRVKVIELMRKHEDNARSNFSYYDVIVRKPEILAAMQRQDVSNWLLDKIKKPEKQFTAQQMRQQLPAVLGKPKVLKRLISGRLTLDEAYQQATISAPQKAIRRAIEMLSDISAPEVRALDANSFNAFKQDVRKLRREYKRISKMADLEASI